ncbi:hypothetical protein CWD94_24075 [Lysinibacillus xylanilyticus]|uniref:Uncharacterized protein n=1 Tax=Lysinibacillus xylanilyticus TaxID=582475 RepID=A0A2M9PZH0_9BACI|nr:hypothetical protein CWD94_24075 [Lysinibacillus xylanilyticus]
MEGRGIPAEEKRIPAEEERILAEGRGIPAEGKQVPARSGDTREDRTFKRSPERFEKLGTVPVDESCFRYIIYLNDLSV